jgi:hypothetical protein
MRNPGAFPRASPAYVGTKIAQVSPTIHSFTKPFL